MGNPIRAVLRYAKRAVLLPWRFHEHARAAAEHRAEVLGLLHTLAGRQAATSDLVNAQTHALATHVSKVLWEELPRLAAEQVRPAVAGPVEAMAAQVRASLTAVEAAAAQVRAALAPVEAMAARFDTALAVVSEEQKALNDRHAACYDRLVEQLRRQADLLAELAERVRASDADADQTLSHRKAA